jgi:uncharacterized membrane protein
LITKLRFSLDLVLAIVATLCLALLVTQFPESSALRQLYGWVYLLLVPGYTWVAALFPEESAIEPLERLGFSVVLSGGVMATLALVLNFTLWGIRLTPLLLLLCLEVLVTCLVANWRRSKLPEDKRFRLRVRVGIPSWTRPDRIDWFLSFIAALSFLAMVVAIVYASITPGPKEAFTEFYVTGFNGGLGATTGEVSIDQPLNIRLTVVSHEHSKENYWIQMKTDKITRPIAAVELMPGETWGLPYTLAPSEVGDDHRVAFQLYKAGEGDLYRSLDLWIHVDVTTSGTSSSGIVGIR